MQKELEYLLLWHQLAELLGQILYPISRILDFVLDPLKVANYSSIVPRVRKDLRSALPHQMRGFVHTGFLDLHMLLTIETYEVKTVLFVHLVNSQTVIPEGQKFMVEQQASQLLKLDG